MSAAAVTGIHLDGDAWIGLAVFVILVVVLFARGRRSS